MKPSPFLSNVQPHEVKPLHGTLAKIATPEAVSPWSPQAKPAPVEQPVIDVEAVRAEAREQGRAEGLAETAKLRAQLATLAAELAAARGAVMAAAAAEIAGAAVAVVEAWIGATDRAQLFAPIIQAWLARCKQPATARVAPADADAVRTAIGDAPITVEADPAIAPGGLALASATLELAFDSEARLRELRDAIAAGLR